MNSWNELSMAEKADIMRIAVSNGITSLQDIMQEYNKFAKGVNKPVTTGGTGYIPNNYGQGAIDYIRKKLYDNVIPFGYNNPVERVYNAVIKNKKEQYDPAYGVSEDTAETLDALWGQYLSIPNKDRHQITNNNGIVRSAGPDNKEYYQLKNLNPVIDDVVNTGLGWEERVQKVPGKTPWITYYHVPIKLGETVQSNTQNQVLGEYQIGRGYDDRGEYLFYKDTWDINPFQDTVNQYGQDKPNNDGLIQKVFRAVTPKKGDASFGIGTPVNIFGKVYLDDIYGVAQPTHATYLPEVTVRGKRRKKALGGNLFEIGGPKSSFVRSLEAQPTILKQFTSYKEGQKKHSKKQNSNTQEKRTKQPYNQKSNFEMISELYPTPQFNSSYDIFERDTETPFAQAHTLEKYYTSLDIDNTLTNNEYLNSPQYKEDVLKKLSLMSKEEVFQLQSNLSSLGFYDLNSDNMSEKEIKAIQEKLYNKGLLGGNKKQAVDGKLGPKTIKAWRQYNVDGQIGNRTVNAFLKSLSPEERWKDDVSTDNTEWCAQWVTKKVENASGDLFGVVGDAWTMPQNVVKAGGEMLYNIYGSNFNNISSEDDLKNRTIKAIKDNPFDIKQLKVGDIVGIYMPSSNMHSVALREGSTYNTHIGVVTGFDGNGVPIIEHNIHKHHHKDKANHLTGSVVGEPKIAVVARPNYVETGAMPLQTKPIKSKYTKEGDNPLFTEYAESTAGAKEDIGKMFPNADMDAVEQIVLAVQGRETNFMRTKGSDLTGFSGLKQKMRTLYRDKIKKADPETVSSDLNKMKLSSFSANERFLLGLKKPSDLNNPELAGRAATYLMAKNYDYFKRLQNTYPELGLEDKDLTYLTELSYNQGMGILKTIGFDKGRLKKEEIEQIRKMAQPDAKVKDVSSTNYRHLGTAGEILYNLFGDPYTPYISAAENYRKGLLELASLNANNKDHRLPTIKAHGGSIHIAPSKRGTFTAAASKHGMGVQEFANRVLANKENYSPAMVKKANFARNASHWKHGLGGNLFSGEEEGSQQMDNGLNLFRNTNKTGDVYYTYQSSPDGEEVRLTPLATIGNDPAYWTWTDDTGKVYTPRVTRQTESIVEKDARNALSRAIGNYFGELKYQADNNIPISGKYTMPAIAMGALLPAVGEAVAGSSIAGVPVTTWADTALTSAFGAHGINHAVNEGINGLGDAAMTALEVAPLGRLAKPMWNAGKDGLQYIAKVADNTARYASPSYDLYRTIGETTPRTTPTYHGFNLNGEQVYTGSPLFEFGQIMRTSPEKAYFMRAPKDVDVLKLGNGKFRHEVVGNETLPSGEVNGKFVSYGEPWKEFALGENSALYEFPVGHRRGQSLIATDWKGRGRKYSVDEVYDYMQQEEALRKELASIKETIGDDFLKQYSTIRRNLINEKYPTLKEHIDTSIYGANQTVIPNERWNFDRFLKTPFWKYSENPISGQIQKELMMRWPETKPFEGITAEWADTARTPQITAENAAKITPAQWTAAQDAAIARGDMAEAQRLSDLHFDIKAENNKAVYDGSIIKSGEEVSGINSPDFYHNTDAIFNSFDVNRTGQNWKQSTRGNKNGVYLSAHYPKSYYGKNKMRLRVYSENPQIMREIPSEDAFSIKKGADVVWEDLGMGYGPEGEVFVLDPRKIKSADAVTYDNNGVRIPLGDRHNFNINDLRYGLIPFGIGLTGYGLFNNQEAYGGKTRKDKK